MKRLLNATIFATSDGVTYSGTAGGSTMTVLPPSDPEQLAKGAGVGMVSHGLTPAGRVARAVAMHRHEQQETSAAQNGVPDAMSLTIKAVFNGGRFHQIAGSQTDEPNVAARVSP